jgi:anthranilate phosphoribosyltransferase
VIGRLLDRHHLSADEAHAAMSTILAGDATPAQLIGFVIALRAKGESAEELSGLLDAVLEAATIVPLDPELRDRAIDIVGTGGDRSHSINVSTMAALVVAAAGVPVCKHGARAASSKCGTADVLEALGVAVELSADAVRYCLDEVGMGFCLAPRFHPAFRFAATARREVGVPTVFNLLGPMANPGRVRRQVIGVANAGFAERMLQSLQTRGSIATWVVHGNGLDELSTTGPSSVLALSEGDITSFEVDPTGYGIPEVPLGALAGGTPAENAEAVRRVMAAERGPHRDIVVLNAAAGLVVGGRCPDLASGIALASTVIDDGEASQLLDRLVEVSRRGAERYPVAD